MSVSRRGSWIPGAGVTGVVSCLTWVLGNELEDSKYTLIAIEAPLWHETVLKT